MLGPCPTPPSRPSSCSALVVPAKSALHPVSRVETGPRNGQWLSRQQNSLYCSRDDGQWFAYVSLCIVRSSLSVCHFAIRWPRASLSGGHFAISCTILVSFVPNLRRMARRIAIAILCPKTWTNRTTSNRRLSNAPLCARTSNHHGSCMMQGDHLCWKVLCESSKRYGPPEGGSWICIYSTRIDR